MNTEDVLSLNQGIEDWVNEYAQDLGTDVAVQQRKHGVDSTENLRASFQKMEADNRLLQIGVIGRVKAGKSSLLNALVFNGENILPRAATPMTAALTTLTWGDTFHAKVDFYSDADQAHLRAAAQAYETLLEQERENARQQVLGRQQKQPSIFGRPMRVDKTSLGTKEKPQNLNEPHDAVAFQQELDPARQDRIEKIAQRAAQENQALAAAHDQWQRITKVQVDADTLESLSVLHADSAQTLAAQLQEFVGADGRYMPLTKSVDIFLPLESLRDIRIIDTPGFNDPVQSREERTEALLKDCDAVLIVSPAGQFLSAQDLDLMNRLTQKEGVQELIVVASQIDMQIYGSEKQATLSATLERLTQTLGHHLRETVQRMKTKHPEIGTTFDGLLKQGAGKILHTSGVCHNLSMRFAEPQSWDKGEIHVWDSLKHGFPDLFNTENAERCRANLDTLANIPALQNALDAVRQRKDAILVERRSSLAKAKADNLAQFHADLRALCRERDQALRETDVKALRQQRKQWENVMALASAELDDLLEEQLSELQTRLKKELKNTLRSAYDKVENTSSESSRETTETRTREKSGLFSWIARKAWGGGTETYTVTVQEVYAAPVRNAIKDFTQEIGQNLFDASEIKIRDFRTALIKHTTRIMRSHLDDADVDIIMLRRAITAVVENITIPEFEVGEVDLSALQTSSTRIRGSDAERFMERASDIVSNLKDTMNRQITALSSAISNAPRTLGTNLFADIQERIAQLEQDIEHKAQSLDRVQRMIKRLDAIKIA